MLSRRTSAADTDGPLALSGVDSDHCLHLEEIAQTVLAPFAAVAGHLEAAERRVHAALRAVQGHLAGTNAGADAPRVQIVLGPYIGRETVRRVVGDLHGLFLVVVGQDAEHGPEDLFARNRHV